VLENDTHYFRLFSLFFIAPKLSKNISRASLFFLLFNKLFYAFFTGASFKFERVKMGGRTIMIFLYRLHSLCFALLFLFSFFSIPPGLSDGD